METKLQPIVMQYSDFLQSDKDPIEVGTSVVSACTNILSKNDMVSNAQRINFYELQNFLNQRRLDERMLKDRKKELDRILEHEVPFCCFYYELSLPIKFAFFSFDFKLPQINMIMLDQQKGSIRIMDIYGQLDRLDVFIYFTKDNQRLRLDFTIEVEPSLPTFITKLVDSKLADTMLKKINIVKLQKEMLQKMIKKQTQNHVLYFSDMDKTTSPSQLSNIKIKEATIVLTKRFEADSPLEDLWKPYFIVK